MTLQDLIEAVQQLTHDDREAVAVVSHLLTSGCVRRPVPRLAPSALR